MKWNAVPDMLAGCARHRPDVPLLVDPDGSTRTAAQLLDEALRGAEALHRLGVRRGGSVAIDTAALSWREVAAAYFSVVWLGAAAVLVTDPETERRAFQEADVSVLVGPEGLRVTGAPRRSPADLLAAPRFAGPSPAGPEDRLDLVFTSGTTGAPKPVVSTHAQWTGSVRPEIMASRTRREVAHTGVPIGLSGGVHGIMLNHVARGVTSVCGQTAGELLATCRARDVYELHLTPHAARALVRLMDDAEPWADRVKIIRVVGGPLPPAVARLLAGRFPRARAVSLYGLTEGGAALCVRVVDGRDHDTIGRPTPGTEVRVLGPDGEGLPAGHVGELAMRAPGTTIRSADGWVRTGDVGYVDDAGGVRLVGRAGELIFMRGGRISPDAVEEILSRVVPQGVEYAVVGVPNTGSWDRIAVFLGGDAGSPRLAEARDRLQAMKGPFRPNLVRVVAAIPRGPFGKPLRRQLMQELSRAAAADR
jgi:long-chain acyl-CoA synthetase